MIPRGEALLYSAIIATPLSLLHLVIDDARPSKPAGYDVASIHPSSLSTARIALLLQKSLTVLRKSSRAISSLSL